MLLFGHSVCENAASPIQKGFNLANCKLTSERQADSLKTADTVGLNDHNLLIKAISVVQNKSQAIIAVPVTGC